MAAIQYCCVGINNPSFSSRDGQPLPPDEGSRKYNSFFSNLFKQLYSGVYPLTFFSFSFPLFLSHAVILLVVTAALGTLELLREAGNVPTTIDFLGGWRYPAPTATFIYSCCVCFYFSVVCFTSLIPTFISLH